MYCWMEPNCSDKRVSKVEKDRSKIQAKCGEVSVHTLIFSNDNVFVANQDVVYRCSKVI